MSDPAAIDRKIFGKDITQAVYGPDIPSPTAPPKAQAQARQLNIDLDTSKSRSRDLLKKRRRSFATRTSQANIRRTTLGGA